MNMQNQLLFAYIGHVHAKDWDADDCSYSNKRRELRPAAPQIL